jgi:hypothetical protein
MLLKMDANGEKLSWPKILNHIEDEGIKQKLVAASALELSSQDAPKAFSDCVNSIKRKQMERRLGELRRVIAEAEREGNQAEISAFTQEYQSLLQQSKSQL